MKKKTTADRLREFMSETGTKQSEILESAIKHAEDLGVKMNRSDISQYVNGKVTPSQEKLSVLSKALGVSEPWLMGYDVPKAPGDTDRSQFSLGGASWSAPLVEGYARAAKPKQEAACTVLDIPYVSPGEPPEREMIELPYFDEAPAAGSPTDAEGHFEMMAFPADEVPTGTSFVTHINGDSMEPTLPDHCYIFVRKTKELRNNQIGVFGLNSGFVCKRARIDVCGQVHALMSDNPKYSDITGDELLGFRPIGEVLGDYCEE